MWDFSTFIIGLIVGCLLGFVIGNESTGWRWIEASQKHKPIKALDKREYHVIRNGDVGKLKYVERYMRD